MSFASSDRSMCEDDARNLVRLSVIGPNTLFAIFLVRHCVTRLSLREVFHCVRGRVLLVLSAGEVDHIRGTARCHTIKTFMASIGQDVIEVDPRRNLNGPTLSEFIDVIEVGHLAPEETLVIDSDGPDQHLAAGHVTLH